MNQTIDQTIARRHALVQHLRYQYQHAHVMSRISSRSICIISLTLRRRRSALDPSSPLQWLFGELRYRPGFPRTRARTHAVGSVQSSYAISTTSRLASTSVRRLSAGAGLGPRRTDPVINPANIGGTLHSLYNSCCCYCCCCGDLPPYHAATVERLCRRGSTRLIGRKRQTTICGPVVAHALRQQNVRIVTEFDSTVGGYCAVWTIYCIGCLMGWVKPFKRHCIWS